MGHPVLGIDQQRLAGQGEQLLYSFDEFHAEHRRRRDDYHRRLVQQHLLHLAEGFPVHQTGWMARPAAIAPASGAGIQHQHMRRARHLVTPALAIEHLANAGILLLRLKPATVGGGHQQLPQRIQWLAQLIRIVAPGLAQQVGEQGVADNPPRERMTIGSLFPVSSQVPVVGNVMVVEDHQARHVGHQARALRQPLDKALDRYFLAGIGGRLLRRQVR